MLLKQLGCPLLWSRLEQPWSQHWPHGLLAGLARGTAICLPCPHSAGCGRALVLLYKMKRTRHKGKQLFAFFFPAQLKEEKKTNPSNMKKRQRLPLGRDRIEALFGSHSPILPLAFPHAPSSILFLLTKFIHRLQGARNEKPLFGVVFSCEFPTPG